MTAQVDPVRDNTSGRDKAGRENGKPPGEQKKSLSIGLSPKAARQLYENLRKRGTPQSALRIGVRGGGCSGFAYVLEFADKPPREGRDLVFSFPVERMEKDEQDPGTVQVYCDKKSIIYLAGSTLDWQKTLMWQGFKFINPQEKGSCGCNESFTV